MNYNKLFNWVIIFLIIAEIALCAYLAYDSYNSIPVCVVGESCSSVQSTSYGYVLGIKLGYVALFAFTVLFFINLYSKKLSLAFSSLGALIALYYIIIQLFVLKSICSTCMIIDSLMIVIFVLSIIRFFVHRKTNSHTNKKINKKKK